jgi:hypothetical protein
MKKILMSVLMAVFTLTVLAEEAVTVRVTGDRVSLRAVPKIDAVLLDRAMTGDELVLKDNSNPDWVGVAAPETVDCWVYAEYIKDGKVTPELLNVRSGPSLSHSAVGILVQGNPVTVRGQVEKWLRIAPPPEATVWISRQYAQVPEPLASVVAEPVEPPAETVANVEPAAAPAAEPAVPEPTLQEVLADMADVSQVPEILKPDPDKEQGVPETFSGVLQPTQSILCKLVDVDVKEIIHCYVRGNLAQMKACAQLPLKITGKAYWAENMEMPIIVPSKIEILSE